jgi:hypothetical protein
MNPDIIVKLLRTVYLAGRYAHGKYEEIVNTPEQLAALEAARQRERDAENLKLLKWFLGIVVGIAALVVPYHVWHTLDVVKTVQIDPGAFDVWGVNKTATFDDGTPDRLVVSEVSNISEPPSDVTLFERVGEHTRFHGAYTIKYHKHGPPQVSITEFYGSDHP